MKIYTAEVVAENLVDDRIGVVFQTNGIDVAGAVYTSAEVPAAIEMWMIRGAVIGPVVRRKVN